MKLLKVLLTLNVALISLSSFAQNTNQSLNSNLSSNTQTLKRVYRDAQGNPMVYDYQRGPRPTTYVLIHGLGDDMSKLENLAQLIRKDGFGVLRVDLQGHGLTLQSYLKRNSQLPEEMPYQKNISDIEGILKEVQALDIVIVGHSYGGGIAYGLAAALEKNSPYIRIRAVHMLAPYVQRIDKFIADYFKAPDLMLNHTGNSLNKNGTKTKNLVTNANPMMIMFTMMAQNARIVASGINKTLGVDEAKDRMLDPFVEKFMQKAYKNYFVLETGKQAFQLTETENKLIDLKVEAAILTTKGIRSFDLLDPVSELPVIKAPLQILGGKKDRLVLPDQLFAFDVRLSNFHIAHELTFIDGEKSGHLFPREMAAETYRQIMDFDSRKQK